jgi:hypothetical protein
VKRKKLWVFPVIFLFYSGFLMAQDSAEKAGKDEEFKTDKVTTSDETFAKDMLKFPEKPRGRKTSENEIVVRGKPIK